MVYLFKLRLHYNEGDKNYVESRLMLAYVSYPSEILGSFSSGSPEFRECIRKNALDLRDLTSQDTVRSQKLNKLADDYRKAANLN